MLLSPWENFFSRMLEISVKSCVLIYCLMFLFKASSTIYYVLYAMMIYLNVCVWRACCYQQVLQFKRNKLVATLENGELNKVVTAIVKNRNLDWIITANLENWNFGIGFGSNVKKLYKQHTGCKVKHHFNVINILITNK